MSDLSIVDKQESESSFSDYFPSVRSILHFGRGSERICKRTSVEYSNEMFCTWLANSIGLPVDTWQLWKEDRTPSSDDHGLWFEESKNYTRPMFRLCYASWLPPDGDNSRCYEIIPASWHSRVTNRNDLLGILMFDLWVAAQRNRPVVYIGQPNNTLRMLFLSHGNVFNVSGTGEIYYSPSLPEIKTILSVHHHVLAGWTEDALAAWTARLKFMDDECLQKAFDYASSSWQSPEWEENVREFLWKRSSKIEMIADVMCTELKKLS